MVEGTTIAALGSSPAQNSNTFVVTADTARRFGLTTLSDLAAAAPELVLGGPPECPTRPLCQQGLRDVYSASFADFVALDAGGPVTRQALDSGGVDVALLFGTDPRLDDYVELFLEGQAKLKVDFEIGDALEKLERLRLVVKSGDRFRAVPLEKALEVLDDKWDNYFQYGNAPAVS